MLSIWKEECRRMSMEQLYRRPGHLIRRAQQIAVAIFMEETEGHDITPVQYAALVAIAAHEELDATRLSALIAFDRSTLGRVLETLEAKGLIQRHALPEDRRVKRLRISRAGRAKLAAVEPAVARAQDRIMAPLPEEERQRFLHALTHLVQVNNPHSRAPMLLAG